MDDERSICCDGDERYVIEPRL